MARIALGHRRTGLCPTFSRPTLQRDGYLLRVPLVGGLLGINEIPQQTLPTVVDGVTEAEITFPPTVLWAFRISSLGLQVVMWATIALVFGALAHRQMEPNVQRERDARSLGLRVSEHRA